MLGKQHGMVDINLLIHCPNIYQDILLNIDSIYKSMIGQIHYDIVGSLLLKCCKLHKRDDKFYMLSLYRLNTNQQYNLLCILMLRFLYNIWHHCKLHIFDMSLNQVLYTKRNLVHINCMRHNFFQYKIRQNIHLDILINSYFLEHKRNNYQSNFEFLNS